ncbi:MAG TPA: hypothetical protein VM692_00955 [Gammaproteobacteria bacterium]|nr:hypothetical protein [Gammaproteobacteria bacterium]
MRLLGTVYESHGDRLPFKDRSGFVGGPDIVPCGCSLDSVLLVDSDGDSDVFGVTNYELLGPGYILEQLEFYSNDLLHGVGLDQHFDFDQAPTTFGRLLVTKAFGGVSDAFQAAIARVRAFTEPSPGAGSCHA